MHPNYFTVLFGEIIVHLGLWLSAWFGPHNGIVWYFFGSGSTGMRLFGAAHLIVAIGMICGLYGKFSWTRLGLLFSVTVYLMQLCLLGAGVIRSWNTPGLPPSAMEGTVYTIGLILLSIAAYREPMTPGHYDARDQ